MRRYAIYKNSILCPNGNVRAEESGGLANMLAHAHIKTYQRALNAGAPGARPHKVDFKDVAQANYRIRDLEVARTRCARSVGLSKLLDMDL